MTPAQYARATERFLEARELSGPEREAALGREADAEVRREVECMLVADAQDGDFLLLGADAPAWPPGLGADRGYRVLGELGRGGSSVVLRAERLDGAFARPVALKLLRGVALSPDARRRFERERRILGTLQHPGLARLLDAGLGPDGAPYLVMELIEGEPLHVYCRRSGLGAPAVVELFLQVLDVVSYAHAQLVVHRDLKPGNILVTADGRPRLLDFGIAKLLEADDEAPATVEGLQALTPRYASPEQVRGDVIGTGSDVYSLGVVLFELLAGVSPYGSATTSAPALGRAICEQDPLPPSVVCNEQAPRGPRPLRADLDAICLQALHKAPEQRYASVAALAEDLRRALRGLPVDARRRQRLYRAGRWLRRSWPVLAAAAAFLALTTTFLVHLRLQLERTALERDRARQLSELLVDLFRSSEPAADAEGRADVRTLLERGSERLALDPSLDTATRAALLQAVGRVHVNLGDLRAAERQLQQALELRRAAGDSVELAQSLHDLANLRFKSGEAAQALELTREALAVRTRLGGEAQEDSAALWNSLAILAHVQGRADESQVAFEKSAELRRRRLPEDEAAYAQLLKNWGNVLLERGQAGEAAERLEQALLIQRRLWPQGHPDLARTLSGLAMARSRERRIAEAEALFEQATQMAQRTFGAGHPELVPLLHNRATFLHALGRLESAEGLWREALGLLAAQGPDHPRRLTVELALARVLADREQDGPALALATNVLAHRRAVLLAGHADLARAEALVGRLRCRGADPQAALTLLEGAVSALPAAAGEPWSRALGESWVAGCLARLGRRRE